MRDGVDDELDGAGGRVVDGPRQGDGLFAHRPASRFIEERRRRFFDDFLMPALERAFALAEVDHVAVLVAEDLNLDVPRMFDEFFEEHAFVAEAGAGFVRGPLEAVAAFVVVAGDPHALAAAAGAGLEHHGIADVAGDLEAAIWAFGMISA